MPKRATVKKAASRGRKLPAGRKRTPSTSKSRSKSGRHGTRAAIRPAILADDIPDRIQTEYRQLLAQGIRDRDVTSRLTKNWKKLLSTKALKEEFWLALAGTQWQLGRLEPAVKKQALAIIDRVLKPTRGRKTAYDEAADHRRKALSSLRSILTSAQPAKKEIRASKAPSSDAEPWPVGEVFAYKLLSGRYVLFHVVSCLGDKATGFWPVFALLDWIGTEPPQAAEVQKLAPKTDPHSASEAVWMVSVVKRHPSDFSSDRIDWLHVSREPHARDIDHGFAVTYWKEKLDEKLRFDFGWE